MKQSRGKLDIRQARILIHVAATGQPHPQAMSLGQRRRRAGTIVGLRRLGLVDDAGALTEAGRDFAYRNARSVALMRIGARVRRWRLAAGIGQGELCDLLGYPPFVVPVVETKPHILARAIRQRIAQDGRAWRKGPLTRRQYVALVAVGANLRSEDQPVMADWLRRARPERARDVATGIAIHAMIGGNPAPFEFLQPVGLLDLDRFDMAFMAHPRMPYSWQPGPDDLLPSGAP